MDKMVVEADCIPGGIDGEACTIEKISWVSSNNWWDMFNQGTCKPMTKKPSFPSFDALTPTRSQANKLRIKTSFDDELPCCVPYEIKHLVEG